LYLMAVPAHLWQGVTTRGGLRPIRLKRPYKLPH